MSIRTDIWVDFNQSPRIVWVTAPSTSISIQDLVDSLRYIEADPYNITFPILIKAAGKDILGGGVLVGLTATLLNAQLAFEARPGPTYVQCAVDGGNLVALDANNNPISPIYPTAFTQVVKTSSSSATISGLEIANLQRLIEGLRPNHKGYGNVWYWDPSAGSDGNTGDHPLRGVKTFAKCHALAVDWNHDIVTIVPTKNAPTIITEPLTITKNYLFLRGAGFNTHLHPTTTTTGGNLIEISGQGCEIAGFHIEGVNLPSTPNVNGIVCTGHHFLIKDTTIEDCTGNGLVISTSSSDDHSIVEDVTIRLNGGSGVVVNQSQYVQFSDVDFEDNGGHGVDLTGSAGLTEDTLFHHCNFHGNGGYGIRIGNANVVSTTIEYECLFSQNTLGDILDLGTGTINQDTINDLSIASAVWAKVLENMTAEEMMRVMLAAMAGKRSGVGSATETYYGRNGTTPRITFSPTDANGNGTPTVNGAP